MGSFLERAATVAFVVISDGIACISQKSLKLPKFSFRVFSFCLKFFLSCHRCSLPFSQLSSFLFRYHNLLFSAPYESFYLSCSVLLLSTLQYNS